MWKYFITWKNILLYTDPGYDDAGDGDLDAGPLEEFVPEVHPVPEGDDVPLDGHIVLAV